MSSAPNSIGYKERNIIVIIPKKQYRLLDNNNNSNSLKEIISSPSNVTIQTQKIKQEDINEGRRELLKRIIITSALSHSGNGIKREIITPLVIMTWFEMNGEKIEFIRTNFNEFSGIMSLDIIQITNELRNKSKIKQLCFTCGSYKIAADATMVHESEILHNAVIISSRFRVILEDMDNHRELWKTNALAVLADKSLKDTSEFIKHYSRFSSNPIESTKSLVLEMFTRAGSNQLESLNQVLASS